MLTGTTAQSSPQGTADFFRYDEEGDAWVRLEDFPGGARSFAYADTYDGMAYVGFGTNDYSNFFNDLWRYDPIAREWTELAACDCRGRSHPAFVAQAGRIFVGLGNGPSNLNDFWSYDIASDFWTQMPDLPGAARHHPFHFAAGGKVYAGMGHGSNSTYYSDWFQFDPATNSWTEMNEHPNGPRVAGQEFSHDGYGYIISGDGFGHNNLVDGEFWKYLHETDEWERLPDHPGNPPDGRVGRWAPGAFVLSDHVHFFGGVNRGGGILYSDMHRFSLKETVSLADPVREAATRIYPNPAVDRIQIRWKDEAVLRAPYSLYNMEGERVMSGKVSSSEDIMLGGTLPPGYYILEIGAETHPVIIQR